MIRAPVRLSVVTAVLLALVSAGYAVDPPKPKPVLTKWIPLYEAAMLQARKDKRPILMFFSSSDADPYTIKLEKDVLNSEMFRTWAADHIVLFQADFPHDRPLSANLKSQNERLKTKFSIVKVPTFILTDPSGLPFTRAGFDEAKLRDDEAKGEPKAWIKFLEQSIANKPPDEPLVEQKNLTECLAYGKKHFISAVLLINQGRDPRPMKIKQDLLENQQFVRYMNRNVAFAELEWPYDTDTSAEAKAFRDFVAEQNVPPAPLQIVVWDMQTHKVKAKFPAINPDRVDTLIALIEAQLPKIDYNAGWIEDLRQAQAISQQQKRYIMLAFTSMDSSEYSKKIFDEIFNTDEFKAYARKKLVTVKIDFPTATTQPAGLVAQNKNLADMFAVRGYPFVVVLNLQMQKIADAKYMKGGPTEFLKELQAAIKNDEERRAFLEGWKPEEQ